MSFWLTLTIMVLIEGRLDIDKGDDIKFGASTDDMIQRFAKQNPQAAADYDEVFGDIRREMEKAEARKREEDQLIRQGKRVPKRTLPEYDMSMEEYETIQQFEKVRREQERQLRAQQQQRHQQQQQQQRHQQRRETEQEMEERLRAEYMNKKYETPEEMEARLRAKIEREMMERKEEIAQRQWKRSNGKEEPKYCLPSPLDSVCDLNIFFSVLACIVTGAFVVALVRAPAPRKRASKKTKKAD